MEEREHTELIETHLPLTGRRIVDIGCGDGALVEFLAERGAHATGVEVQQDTVRCARTNGTYVVADGAQLPFADMSVNGVIFINSLHNMTAEQMGGALAEARRILLPGGHALIIEPMPEGEYFELVRAVDDETEPRAAAYEVIRASRDIGLHPVLDDYYERLIPLSGPEELKGRLLTVNPAREARWIEAETEIAAAFERCALRREGKPCFKQPYRLNLLQRL